MIHAFMLQWQSTNTIIVVKHFYLVGYLAVDAIRAIVFVIVQTRIQTPAVPSLQSIATCFNETPDILLLSLLNQEIHHP